jgi:hypothetical protein
MPGFSVALFDAEFHGTDGVDLSLKLRVLQEFISEKQIPLKALQYLASLDISSETGKQCMGLN